MGIALAAAATTEIEMAQLLTIVFVFLICSFTPSPNLVQLLGAFPARRGAFVCIALHPVAMPIVPCALQMACVQKSQKQSFLPRFMFHSLQLSAILCCISGLLKCTALQHSALRCRALQWESLWQWQQEQKLKWCNCWQWFLSCCFVFSSITQFGAILACVSCAQRCTTFDCMALSCNAKHRMCFANAFCFQKSKQQSFLPSFLFDLFTHMSAICIAFLVT